MSLDLKSLYDQLNEAITDIDEKLDSLDDSGAITSRKIINELVTNNKETWENVATALVSQLSTVPIEVQAGVFYGLVRELDSTIGKSVKEYITQVSENAPKPEPLITVEEAPKYQEDRKALYAKIKALVEMAKTFGDEDADKMELPKRRMGSTGPRGKRALSLFTWSIEDVSYDKLKDVVEQYPQYEAVKDLTQAMRDAKIDTKTPGNRIEFTLPDGKILIGINTAPVDDTDEDDEDEEVVDTDDGTDDAE